MTTATNITIPCTASNLTALMQQWKNSIADAPAMPTMAARPMSASEIAAFLNAAFDFCIGCEVYLRAQRLRA